MLKPGENPRSVLPQHVERGPVAFMYTLKKIALAANINYQTVRKAVSRELLDPDDLRSVAGYIQRALARKSRPVKGPEVLGKLPQEYHAWWEKRWPKFQLFLCAALDCDRLLFTAGCCSEHGGDRKPGIRLSADGHIQLLLNGKDYVPLHRVVAQTPPGMHTHHRDGNPWNNRYNNIECLSPEEHQTRHWGGVLTGQILPKQPPRKPLRSEVGGLTKQQIQKKVDEAYQRGLKQGAKS